MSVNQPPERPAEPVASPCTGICRIDPESGWCSGCLRSLDEIAAWSRLDEPARRRLLDDLPRRRADDPAPPSATPPHARSA